MPLLAFVRLTNAISLPMIDVFGLTGVGFTMPQGRAAVLGDDFAILQRRLIAVTESKERLAIIEEMQSILEELKQLIHLAEAADAESET
jgi:hypothetical protein